jgi:hypothetical protein
MSKRVISTVKAVTVEAYFYIVEAEVDKNYAGVKE